MPRLNTDHRAPRAPAPRLPPPAHLPPPARHQHLPDCMAWLRRRHLDAAGPVDPVDRPADELPVLKPGDFTQPKQVTLTVQAQVLPPRPDQAKYSLLPPGFSQRDALLAYELPGHHSRTRYHECQSDERCGLSMLNMLAMALNDNDFRVLCSRTQLDEFVFMRHATTRGSHYAEEDLRDFHNHFRDADPVLALVSATVRNDGLVVFDTGSDAQMEYIDHAAAVGLSFIYSGVGASVPHAVIVRRSGRELFELLDSRSPRVVFMRADSMSTALASYVRDLAGNRGDDRPHAFKVIFPSPTAPAPAEPPSAVTWF